jgi:hypothetical protein
MSCAPQLGLYTAPGQFGISVSLHDQGTLMIRVGNENRIHVQRPIPSCRKEHLYVNTGGNIRLTTLFHAARSFFVIVNDGIGLAQQMWLLAGVYLGVALIIVILAGSDFARRHITRISQAVVSALDSHWRAKERTTGLPDPHPGSSG